VLIVRSSRDVAAELERLIARLDPALPVDNSGSLKQVLAVAFFPSYLATLALGAFGVLAAMLAVTGIYGIASYSVSRRRREIGIRMAIGARAGDVLRFVLGRTAILVLAGAALGLAGGIAASAVLAKVVYGASSHDPSVLAAVTLSMAAVALGSVASPARKAISVDPQQALRMD
jgi:ABC-type antimicrobial peptide transport system permease subunit